MVCVTTGGIVSLLLAYPAPLLKPHEAECQKPATTTTLLREGGRRTREVEHVRNHSCGCFAPCHYLAAC